MNLFKRAFIPTLSQCYPNFMPSLQQKKAIDYLQINGKITTKEYLALTKTSLRTARRDLIELKNKNIIQYLGSDKEGHYILLGTEMTL